MAALIVALAISVTTAQALTSNQVQEIKKTVLSVPVPEMPAKAAELVTNAQKKDKQAVAVTAVRAVISKHRAAAPLVISAISKAAPELAPAVVAVATEAAGDQSAAIARAAVAAAPAQQAEIAAAVNKGSSVSPAVVASSAPSVKVTRPSNPFGTRSTASSSTTQGNIIVTQTKIDGEAFPEDAPETPDSPSVVVYNQPPQ